MIVDHGHFEILCALGASGQLTRQELEELREHSQFCTSCSKQLVEMTQLGVDVFLVSALRAPKSRTPAGMRQRFLARAINEGIPLRDRKANCYLPNALGVLAVMSLLFVLVAVKPGIELFSRYFWKSESTEIAGVSEVPQKSGLIQSSPTNSLPEIDSIHQGSARRISLPRHPKASLSASFSRAHKQRSVDGIGPVMMESRNLFLLHPPHPSDSLERSTGGNSKVAPAFMTDMPAEFTSVSFSAIGRDHVSQLWTDSGRRSFGRQGFPYEGRFASASPQELYRASTFETLLPDFKPDFKFSGPEFRFAWNMVQ